jgi:lipopolysaccharide export system protein LptA
LSVARPEAFGFLSNRPAAIEIQGSVLRVSEGKDLSMIGGDLTIADATLNAPAGRVNLASVASKGEVMVSDQDLKIDSFEKLGKITLSSAFDPNRQLANIDVSSSHAGQVFIRAGQLVLNGGIIFADVNSAHEAVNTAANQKTDHLGIDIQVTDRLELNNGALITADIYGEGQGQGSNIIIKAGSVKLSVYNKDVYEYYLSPESQFSAEMAYQLSLSYIGINNSSPKSRGGNIRIQAESLEVNPGVLATFASEDAGPVGNIEIKAQQVTLAEGGYIKAETQNVVKSGHITLNSSKISLRNSSFITASSSNSSPSDIDINTQRLTLEGSWISSFNYYNIGNAGTIHIQANDSIVMSDVSAVFAIGNGGKIKIETPSITVSGNSWIDPGLNGLFILNNTKLSDLVSIEKLPRQELPLLLTNRCAAFSKENLSRFIITARDILPRSPEDWRTHSLRLPRRGR